MIIGVDVRSLMEGRHSGVEEYAIKIIRAMMKQAPNNEWVLFYNSWRNIMLPDFGSAVKVVAFCYIYFNGCRQRYNNYCADFLQTIF